MSSIPLVLASSSPFRKGLLTRLTSEFSTFSPDVDESPQNQEQPGQLASRLALSKAQAGAQRYPQHLIIGSDQVAICDQQTLSKPGSHARAVEQLSFMSGKLATFYTGLCLLDSATGQHQLHVEEFAVQFKELTASQANNYLDREVPYGCAGSFKSEALGIALCQRFDGRDPTALIGLPLIKLVEMLEQAGSPVI